MRAPWLLLLAALTGCAANDSLYQESTLEAVLRHREPSRTERYLIDMPAIAAVRGNTGIIREGSLFAIIAGPDLKDVVHRWPAGVRYGVHFKREPRIHLVVERVVAGDEVVDLLGGREGFRYDFPDLVDPADVPRGDYEPRDPADLATAGTLAELTDVPFSLEEPAATTASVIRGRPSIGRLDRPRFFVGPPDSRWLVVGQDRSVCLMLDFLLAEKKKFSGGVAVSAVLPAGERAAAGISGMIEIRWIHLGGAMYFRSS